MGVGDRDDEHVLDISHVGPCTCKCVQRGEGPAGFGPREAGAGSTPIHTHAAGPGSAPKTGCTSRHVWRFHGDESPCV